MSSRAVVTTLSRLRDPREELADDARRGLTATPKHLPPKHLYDARGSELFEAITRLPEYPVTRTESALLEAAADDIVAAARPAELLELGSGSSRKTRLLLEAMHRQGTGDRYAPLDVSVAAVAWHLPEVAASLDPEDRFLLGVDLVKPPAVLEAAYDDAAGITARFTTNLLVVLNRELDGDLPVDAFAHRARWDAGHERVELTLEATRAVRARLAAIDLEVTFAAGEHLLVEHSCKFRVAGITGELAAAGLEVEQLHGGEDAGFALLLARRR